ncbi:hypothetical protein BH10ACI1_BH10ACI1_28350 [soil metagenome]
MNQENSVDLSADEIADQASGKESDEIQREILRGGKDSEEADESDNAGSLDSSKTPQGGIEIDNNLGGFKNKND